MSYTPRENSYRVIADGSTRYLSMPFEVVGVRVQNSTDMVILVTDDTGNVMTTQPGSTMTFNASGSRMLRGQSVGQATSGECQLYVSADPYDTAGNALQRQPIGSINTNIVGNPTINATIVAQTAPINTAIVGNPTINTNILSQSVPINTAITASSVVLTTNATITNATIATTINSGSVTINNTGVNPVPVIGANTIGIHIPFTGQRTPTVVTFSRNTDGIFVSVMGTPTFSGMLSVFYTSGATDGYTIKTYLIRHAMVAGSEQSVSNLFIGDNSGPAWQFAQPFAAGASIAVMFTGLADIAVLY